MLPFNPIKRAKDVERIVVKNGKRKYYRFRFARYYGGIATLDTIGCCLLCAYCWNYFRNLKPENYGNFYSPEEACDKIISIMERRKLERVRISGGEPILGEKSFNHLIKVIQTILELKPEAVFILETNGIMLGYEEKFCKKISEFPVFVRISLKGWDEDSFEKISGAEGKFFELPLIALRNLRDLGIEAWPAIMHEIFYSHRKEIEEKIKDVGVEIEEEYLEAYPFVIENLKKRGISFKASLRY